MEPCAQLLAEQQVAGQPRRAALEVEAVRFHAQPCAARCQRAYKVGLQPAEADHLARAARVRVGQQIGQFAHLVTAHCQPHHVVALDP